jgi:hypothetical protein
MQVVMLDLDVNALSSIICESWLVASVVVKVSKYLRDCIGEPGGACLN